MRQIIQKKRKGRGNYIESGEVRSSLIRGQDALTVQFSPAGLAPTSPRRNYHVAA